MKNLTDFKISLEMTFDEVNIIIARLEQHLTQTRKIHFLNNERIESFTTGSEKDINLYKGFANLIGKQDVAEMVITKLCSNIEEYFSDEEKETFKIGVTNVAELNNLSNLQEGNNDEE